MSSRLRHDLLLCGGRHVAAFQPTVQLFGALGWRVDCVDTIDGARNRLQRDQYIGVLLAIETDDGRLTLLSEPALSAGWPPVVALMSNLLLRDCVRAIRLGASDCRAAPLSLGDVVELAVQFLHQAGPASRDSGSTGAATRMLVVALQDPLLDIRLFVRCAQALAQVQTVQSFSEIGGPPWDLPLSYPPLSPGGRQLLTSLSNRTFACQIDLAGELCLPVKEFRRVIKRDIGLTFTEVRTALRVRTGVKALMEVPGEHVRQIAFALGYEHAGQFTRDFGMLVGMTPSSFRRLSR